MSKYTALWEYLCRQDTVRLQRSFNRTRTNTRIPDRPFLFILQKGMNSIRLGNR